MTTTAMRSPLLRSALCLAMLAVCFVSSQCTANTSDPGTNNTAVRSENGGSTSGGNSLVNAALYPILDFVSFVVRKVANVTKTTGNGSDLHSTSGSEKHSSSGSQISANTNVDGDSDSGFSSDVSHSSSGKNTAVDSSLTRTTTTTTANAGTVDAQEELPTKDTPRDTSVNNGDEPALTQTTTGENSDVNTMNTQTTASATSVQTVMSSSSTAVPKDSTQTSANSTTEPAKGDYTAAAKLLPKLANAVQSADIKDGIVGCSSVFALSALITVVVMAVAPSF